MAKPEASQTIKEVKSPNLVQEIVEKGGEIPENYILKDGYPEAIDAPAELWRDNLLIDFSLFSSSTPAAEAELVKLRSALSEWGCFQAINLGIESSFLEELIKVLKQFFALPVVDKLKYFSADDVLAGYGTDSALGIWNDRLILSVHPEEKRKLQFWPQKPEQFREMVDEFSMKLLSMKENLYKAMAKSLNLEEECFLKNQGRQGPLTMRFNFHPRCPCPDLILGGIPHTDASTMTILLPEKDVEGLQVEKDGYWYKVPVIPGALFVNVGDMGEVMSNGVFKSVLHRVIANSAKERVSLAAFYNSEEELEIGPVSELISDQRPQLYKTFNFLGFKQTFEALSRGSKPLDALRL